MKKILNNIKHVVISFAAAILLWQIGIWLGDTEDSLLPSPLQTLDAFKELCTTGLQGSTSDATLFIHIGDSLGRFFLGYFLSAIAGIVFGLLFGRNPRLFSYVNPVIQIVRPIAPIAWLPFIVLLIGIGDIPAVIIIFIAGFFTVMLSTVSAVKHIDKVYQKVADNFGLSTLQTVLKVVFPAVFPQIASSLHMALGTCWIFLVSGEMVGSQTGLGFLIMDTKNCLRADALIAVIITIGVIGFILDLLINLFEKSVKKAWGLGINE